MNQFWMVGCEDSSMMKFKHSTEKLATDEAERLAASYPSKKFFIMKAIAYMVSVKPVDYQILTIPDEIPF